MFTGAPIQEPEPHHALLIVLHFAAAPLRVTLLRWADRPLTEEARMTKTVTALASAAALALFASAAYADCSGAHNVTASAEKEKQVVAMTTVQEPVRQPAIEQSADKPLNAAPVCAAGKNDCPTGTE